MKSKFVEDWKYLQPGLRVLIVLILGLGIFFRLGNLDRKIYWHDETATSLRMVGYSKSEFVKQVFNGQPISVEEIHQKFQSLNSERNLGDTFNALKGRPEHSPLYYLMARFWAQAFGSSVSAMRTLPALISLLAFPGIYWLCMELFESSLVAWIAVALIAVSPMHILYAQEARQYSLWIVTILLSSASLLRAIRLKTNLSWGIYGATVALGLYSHLFFGLVALGHGIYVGITEGFQRSKNTIAYCLSSLGGLFAFLPWLWIAIASLLNSSHQDRILKGVSVAIPLSSLLDKWFRNLNRVFHDANLGSANIILFIFAIYSIYFVCRHSPKRVWLFILTLMGVTALTLALPDLILGGQRSVRTRYFMSCYIGIELAVAYLLATGMTASLKIWQQKVWQVVTLLLISLGIVSGVISSQSQVWWNKNISVTRHFPKIAETINKAEKPLVVGDGSETSILSLSYLLEKDVKFQLVRKQNLPNIPTEFTTVFLFDASETLRERLEKEKNYRIEFVSGKKKAQLWKVVR